MKQRFHIFAHKSAELVGSPWAFLFGVLVTIVWAVTGPIFQYSDSWQLVINTGTTVITFLTVFLIQNTQNRDARTMHLKLDELIRAVRAARTHLVHLEDMSDEDLATLEKEFQKLHDKMQNKPSPKENRQES